MVHFLGEDDVELDNQIATWTVRLLLQLGGRVGDDVAAELARHAFSGDSELGLGSDHLLWRNKDLSIIK